MALDARLVKTIKTNLADKSSDELRRMLGARNTREFSDEAFEAARELLSDRAEGRAQEPATETTVGSTKHESVGRRQVVIVLGSLVAALIGAGVWYFGFKSRKEEPNSLGYPVGAGQPNISVSIRRSQKSTTEVRVQRQDVRGEMKQEVAQQPREDRTWIETVVLKKEGILPARYMTWQKLNVVIESDQAHPQLTGKTFYVEKADKKIAFRAKPPSLLQPNDEVILRQHYWLLQADDTFENAISQRDFLSIGVEQGTGKWVRVGQSWTWEVPAKNFAAWLKGEPLPYSQLTSSANGGVVPVITATAKGHLRRVYEKDRHRFGEIDVTITIQIRPNVDVPERSGAIEIKINYNGCIDGDVCECVIAGKISGRVNMNDDSGSWQKEYSGTIDYFESEVHKASPSDERHAKSAREHIQHARSTPMFLKEGRVHLAENEDQKRRHKEVELNRAETEARQIQDASLKREIEQEIADER